MALTLEISQGAGGREDLANILANVDAHDTIVTSTCKKGSKPGNTLMEVVVNWLTRLHAQLLKSSVTSRNPFYQETTHNSTLVVPRLT